MIHYPYQTNTVNPYAIIIAGGTGTRFWPLSTPTHPKPFCSLLGKDLCLLEATWQRLPEWISLQKRIVVVQAQHRERVIQLCPGILEENILCEPQERNTAAAIALATAWIKRQTPRATLVVLPADHAIDPQQAFHNDLKKACAHAHSTQEIVLIGARPTRPETGYGYIEVETPSLDSADTVLSVKRFWEKPDAQQAQGYLEAKTFLWNCGLVIAGVDTLQKEISQHLPEHGQLMASIESLRDTAALPSLLQRLYARLPAISMDYGVLEKNRHCWVLKASFNWSDVGDWAALAQDYPQDASGNTLLGHGHLKDAHNVFVYNTHSGHPVVTLGLEDCVVIHTPEATLICSKQHVQAVRAAAQGISFSYSA